MGYKKRYRKKAYTKNKKAIIKSKSAKSQQKQLLSLQRQVKRLTVAEKGERILTTYMIPQQPVVLKPPSTITPGFNVFHLTNPVNLVPIFSSDFRSETQREATVKFYHLKMKATPNDSLVSLPRQDVQMWLVKLKRESGAALIRDTLNLNGLDTGVPGRWWYANLNDANVFDEVTLNPKYFDIKKYRKFSIANIMQETANVLAPEEDVATVAIDSVYKSINIYHKCNTKIVNVMGDLTTQPPGYPEQNWHALQELETALDDRFYLITHVGGYEAPLGQDPAAPRNTVELSCNWTVGIETHL